MLAFHCAGIHYLLHILTTTWLNFCAFRICLLWWGVRRLALCAIVFFFYPYIFKLGLLVFHAWALSPACLDIFYILVNRVAGVGIYLSLPSNRNFTFISPCFTFVIGWTMQCYPLWITFFLSCKFRRLAGLCGIADWKTLVEPRWLWSFFFFCFWGVCQFISWKIPLVTEAESSRHARLISDGRSRR